MTKFKTMNKFIIVTFYILILGLLPSFAEMCTNTKVDVIAADTVSSTAHLLAVQGCQNGETACGYLNSRMFIDQEDKQLFAFLVTAQLNKQAVNIIFDKNFAPNGVFGHENVACKVLNAWFAVPFQ